MVVVLMKKKLLFICASTIILAVTIAGCRRQQPQNFEPRTWTQGTENISETEATLNGTVNPNASATTAWFEWGTDPDLTAFTETPHRSLGTGAVGIKISADLTGLAPDTIYYYRAIGMNHAGTSKGKTGFFSTQSSDRAKITVTTLIDQSPPPADAMTIRQALENIASGGTITFAPALNGGTINLQLIGSNTSLLKAEVFTLGMGWVFQGFQLRSYGNSALYAEKNVTIDASSLPDGITLRWDGGDASRARVLAIYGNLTMKNVTVTSGYALSEPLSDENQPYTLARGGGLAVWGTAVLDHCTIYGNTARGDENPSRDRGAFGGGIYADMLTLNNCVVSGNAAKGFGAAGGGIYSVSGADGWGQGSTLTGCSVTGNRVTGQHAYGGGVYSDGGGPGNAQTLQAINCTIARNLVEDNPDIEQDDLNRYYYRGGGIYMSNGLLSVEACTIAENTVTGHPRVFNKPNMGGGGIAATIGNAHVVENMQLQHSIIAGNTVNSFSNDVYTGSLVHFYSWGYNLIGTLDFSQILVPIPAWNSLSRKHWPKTGDREGIAPADALDMNSIMHHNTIISVGADAGEPAVLWYQPTGSAVDKIPVCFYGVNYLIAQYEVTAERTDDFLNHVLAEIRTKYGDILGHDFGEDFGDMSGITWYGPSVEWPTNPQNAAWIQFWRNLDSSIGDRLGDVKLGDDFWGSFKNGPLGDNVTITVETRRKSALRMKATDQQGNWRPAGMRADIGAIEAAP
jgi:hypothetical protein